MTTAAKTRFKFVGSHLDDLADGRLLQPGETYTLDRAEVENPHNAQRIAAGLLLEVPHANAKGSDRS